MSRTCLAKNKLTLTPRSLLNLLGPMLGKWDNCLCLDLAEGILCTVTFQLKLAFGKLAILPQVVLQTFLAQYLAQIHNSKNGCLFAIIFFMLPRED